MFEATFNAIDRVLWKEEGCNTELDYTVSVFEWFETDGLISQRRDWLIGFKV
jgi:hypothetical protein